MKYVILAASVLIQTCIGGLYAWSEFVPALTAAHGISTAQTQLIFGLLIAVFTVSMVVAGGLLNRVGPRWVALCGGLAFGLGYLIASRSGGDFGVLLLGIGVVTGIGTGCCYVCPLIMCAKWFPERKGLATGMAVAGFGGGAIALSTMGDHLLNRGIPVLDIFAIVGILYGGLIVAAALSFRMPEGQAPARSPLRFHVLTRDRQFWGLALGMFAGTFAGLLIIGNLKPMALSRGVGAATATIAISAFAIGNALGRISWGWVADQLGARVIPLSLAFLAAMVLLSWLMPGSAGGTIVVACLIGAGFGACFVVYAAQTAAHFGADQLGSVYPLVFLAYGLSGLLGPWLGGSIYDHTQSYSGALLLSLAVLLAAIPLCLGLLRRPAPAPVV